MVLDFNTLCYGVFWPPIGAYVYSAVYSALQVAMDSIIPVFQYDWAIAFSEE